MYKKIILLLVLVPMLSLVSSGSAVAQSSYPAAFTTFYQASYQAKYPGASLTIGVCTLCHTSAPTLNAYGTAYLNSGHNFKTIEALDSDGDGFSNLTEIMASPETFPGLATSHPPAADTVKPLVTAFAIPATASSLVVAITTLTATDAGGVTGYMVTESATAPLAGAAGWVVAKPANYTFASAGAKTLYAWAKDAAGNVSLALSAPVTITIVVADTVKPLVTAFAIPATASSLVVAITTLTATDAGGVTGYMVTESSTAPLAGDAGWAGTIPANYTFASAGAKTLYAWAKDAAGNVSLSMSAPVTITIVVADTVKPLVTAFAVPATASSLVVPITTLTATDAGGVTGYMVTESSTAPLAGDAGWAGTIPANYTFASAGAKTLYAWAKDAAGNVSLSMMASVTVSTTTTIDVATTLTTTCLGCHADNRSLVNCSNSKWLAHNGSRVSAAIYDAVTTSLTGGACGATTDTVKPLVTAFTIPATASSLVVPITTLTATDAVGVTGYMVTESATAPLAGDAGWAGTIPANYTFASAGAKTLYAWAKDAAGNVSLSMMASVTVSTTTTIDVATTLTTTCLGCHADNRSLVNCSNSKWLAHNGSRVSAAIYDAVTTSLTGGACGATTDTVKPLVTAFAIPATASSLVVPITTLTATDAVGVTGYMVTESATAPLAGATGWAATKPANYTFASAGAKTLYAWAKDAAGNVSLSMSAPVTITIVVADTVKPLVTAFTVPATASSLMVPITTLTATDAVGVTGYMVTESATAPLAGATGWAATKPANHTCASAGAKTLYAWAKDAAGNVSLAKSAPVTIAMMVQTDKVKPLIMAFSMPATSSSLVVSITTLTATDAAGIKGYMVKESATAPLAGAAGWTATKPKSYTFASTGAKKLYAFAKDAAGNVSLPRMASVTVTNAGNVAKILTTTCVKCHGDKRTRVKCTSGKWLAHNSSRVSASIFKAVSNYLTGGICLSSTVRTTGDKEADDGEDNEGVKAKAAASTLGSQIPLPGEKMEFSYAPVKDPVVSFDPSKAMPIGVGTVATGGDKVSLKAQLAKFAGPVDVSLYMTFSTSSGEADDQVIKTYAFDAATNKFELISGNVTPWKSGVVEFNQQIWDNLPVSGFAPGRYKLILGVTPAGQHGSYYNWTTYFTIK